jgi:hypothetical protein
VPESDRVVVHELAQPRPQSVGGNRRDAVVRRAVGAHHAHAVGVLFDVDDAARRFEHDARVGAARCEQDIEQIAAVHHDVRMAVVRAKRVAEIERRDLRAAARVAPHEPARKHGERRDRVEHAEVFERVRRVRRELQSRADLAELRGAFEHVHRAADARDRERRRKPADPAAGDQQRERAHTTGRMPSACVRSSATRTPKWYDSTPPSQPDAPSRLSASSDRPISLPDTASSRVAAA